VVQRDYLWSGPGIRRSERSRGVAERSLVGGTGREGEPRKAPLAGKSTLNRLELTQKAASREERYKEIVLHHGAVDQLQWIFSSKLHWEEPQEIIVDLDATYDPMRGKQEGRFFHSYMGTTPT
jgi:hypothetical protein